MRISSGLSCCCTRNKLKPRAGYRCGSGKTTTSHRACWGTPGRSWRMSSRRRARAGWWTICEARVWSLLVSLLCRAVCGRAADTDVGVGLNLQLDPELAEGASQPLGTQMEFESIEKYVLLFRSLSCSLRSCSTGVSEESWEIPSTPNTSRTSMKVRSLTVLLRSSPTRDR